MYAITPTPYNECTQLVQKILWFNWMKVTLRSRQTAYIHCTELVWPRTFIVRSWCNRVEWLYGVGLCLLYCTVLYCTVTCAYPPQPGQVESHKDIETRLPGCRWWTTTETRSVRHPSTLRTGLIAACIMYYVLYCTVWPRKLTLRSQKNQHKVALTSQSDFINY